MASTAAAESYKRLFEDFGKSAIKDAMQNSEVKDMVRVAMKNKQQYVAVSELAGILNVKR